MFTLFGYFGQMTYNTLDARHTKQVVSDMEANPNNEERRGKGFWQKLADQKWSPITALSDEEYANMLKERMLRVDAEIALVDEEIERSRGEERTAIESQSKDPIEEQ